MLGGMTMWSPSEAVEEDVSNLPGIEPQGKRRRSRRCALRDGLADQTVVKTLEDVRCYRAFERALIGSVDPRSALELALVHRLEPISKSPEEDNEASELYEAEEVLGVVFPTDEDAALPLNPSKEALHEPASHIAA